MVNIVGSEVDSLNHSINCCGRFVGSSQAVDDDMLSDAKYSGLLSEPDDFLLEFA